MYVSKYEIKTELSYDKIPWPSNSAFNKGNVFPRTLEVFLPMASRKSIENSTVTEAFGGN